jgi:hypothetical protein
MADPTDPTLPPFGDDTDEAVSALVDGELAAFARDHDLLEAEVHSRLERWPGLADARRALGALRDAPPSVDADRPLDTVTRRRLVRGAMDATASAPAPSRSSRNRALLWTGSAAAAAAAIVGLVAIVGQGSARHDAAKTSSAASEKDAAGGGSASSARYAGDLGDVTDPASLRVALVKAAAPAAPAAGDFASRSQDQNGSPAPSPELTTCAAKTAAGRPVQFVATATYRGQRAAVVAVADGGRTAAYVTSLPECTVLTFQSS